MAMAFTTVRRQGRSSAGSERGDMTVPEIIDTIEAAGGQLLVEGENLRLKAPVQLSAEVKTAFRTHKPELLDKLCPHAPGCPHTFAQMIAEFERAGRLRVEYDGHTVWLVRSGQHRPATQDATVYTLSEWERIA